MIASCGCEKGPILGRVLNLCMKFRLRRLFDLLHGPIVLPPTKAELATCGKTTT